MKKRITNMIDKPIIPIIVTLLVMLVALYLMAPYSFTPIPQDTTLVYRTVESTGIWGASEYYLFDTSGTRYKVSQKTFDSYVDLPRH